MKKEQVKKICDNIKAEIIGLTSMTREMTLGEAEWAVSNGIIYEIEFRFVEETEFKGDEMVIVRVDESVVEVYRNDRDEFRPSIRQSDLADYAECKIQVIFSNEAKEYYLSAIDEIEEYAGMLCEDFIYETD